MLHRIAALVLAVVAFGACRGSSTSRGVRPQPVTPAPPPAPPVPAVETGPSAEQLFTSWLEAFNARDRDGLVAFAKHLTPAIAKEMGDVESLLGFRENVGGFDLKKVEEAKPDRYVAIVKEHESDQFARVSLELDTAHAITKFDVRTVATPDEFRTPRLTEAAALEALRTELERLAAADRFAGAVLVAKAGKPVFSQAYGFADRAAKRPNTVDTRFRIGSMNKMFTAVATLQLVQAGKLKLDDTVGKILPDYPNKDVAAKVTIHHLLTHTGGTGDIFTAEYAQKRTELRTLQDYVKLFGARAPLHEPGAQMKYSNYGFVLLGVIVEQVAKQTYYDRVAQTIFKPAGMRSTESPFEDAKRAIPHRSIAYTKSGPNDEPLPAWMPATDLPIRASSAGGGDSTVTDLLKFAIALTSHKLLDAKHTELLTRAKPEPPIEGHYAYGFVDTTADGASVTAAGPPG